MPTISKGVLKAKMLEYFRKVEETGEELIVTDHRVPVLKVVPIRSKKPLREAFADAQGKLRYKGDLTEPDTNEWEDA